MADFYKETEGKIKAEKKSSALKMARNVVLALSCGTVLASCATGHSYTNYATYRYGNTTYRTTTSYSEVDAARANYLNAKAGRQILDGVSNFYRTVRRYR